MAGLPTTIRMMFCSQYKAQMILEEAKMKDSGVVVLQHDKQTGNLTFIRKHPKSKDHVVYSGLEDGKSSDIILHRKHVQQMMDLLDKDKEKK